MDSPLVHQLVLIANCWCGSQDIGSIVCRIQRSLKTHFKIMLQEAGRWCQNHDTRTGQMVPESQYNLEVSRWCQIHNTKSGPDDTGSGQMCHVHARYKKWKDIVKTQAFCKKKFPPSSSRHQSPLCSESLMRGQDEQRLPR